MADKSPQEDLDWNTLSNPVPLDFIDPEFPSQATDIDHSGTEPSLPGARSEILPREESDALLEAHAAQPELPPLAALPAEPTSSAPLFPSTPPFATFDPPAPSSAPALPADGFEPSPAPFPFQSAYPPPLQIDNPPTIMMEAKGLEKLADDFSRMRAKMDADAETEKQAKLEAEKEEASQHERLEQWMANARARLLKADADLTGPSGRVRIRKDHSPSLYRLAELQKTMIVKGEDTIAQSPNGTLYTEAKAPAVPVDPMATISVTADQFMAMEPPLQPTAREQALARQAAQQTAAQQASHQMAANRAAKEQEAAQAKADALIPRLLPDNAPPLTREQALTRKVAQLRKVAEDSETVAPQIAFDSPDRKALQYAIAAVVIIAIALLGLGLFAATQAGLFDGLEKQLPFLRPKMSTQQRLNPAGTLPSPTSPPSSHMGPATESPTAPAPGAPAGAGNPTVDQARAQTQAQSAAGLNRYPAEPAIAAARSALPVEPAAVSHKTVPAPRSTAAQRRANSANSARLKKSLSANAEGVATAATAGDAPIYDRVRPKASNLGEIILRASVQAATNIDADNLQAMYNRYALGFPGLSGEVVIGLTVDPGGRVLEGSIVSSSTGVEAFDQELLRKVLDWRLRAFPDSRPKFITVPFLFPLQGR